MYSKRQYNLKTRRKEKWDEKINSVNPKEVSKGGEKNPEKQDK